MVRDADALDAVYGVFLRHLCMTSDRRRTVLGRDRSIPRAIRDRMPPLLVPPPRGRTSRETWRAGLVHDLRDVAPDEFLRTLPELSARRGGGYAALYGREEARYLEPWRDEHGRTVALRAYMGPGAKPKYLTSPSRTGPLLHFAFGAKRERVDEVPWLLTEGWMKAEVAAHHLGAVAVGFAGVTAKQAWRRALDAKQRLAPNAPTYVAFDAEVWTTRPDIAVHALELAWLAQRVEGRPAGFAAWQATATEEGKVQPKGIDDAIVSGAHVHLVERIAFGAYLGPALREWECRVAA